MTLKQRLGYILCCATTVKFFKAQDYEEMIGFRKIYFFKGYLKN